MKLSADSNCSGHTIVSLWVIVPLAYRLWRMPHTLKVDSPLPAKHKQLVVATQSHTRPPPTTSECLVNSCAVQGNTPVHACAHGRSMATMMFYTWPGSNWRPSACWADVIATRPQVLEMELSADS